MRKYFLYELKKHFWTLVVLTALCAIPYMVNCAAFDMTYEYGYGITYETGVHEPMLENVFVELVLLLYVVPVLVYSFKMSKRSVDGYYSLPLKKEKLYFVATMVGLILVFVPFTVSYWGGFLTLLLREGNPYNMGYYVPAYFGGLCIAVFLYGVNAFAFTRGNRVIDGIVFMAANAFIGLLFIECMEQVIDLPHYGWRFANTFYFSGSMFTFIGEMTNLIVGQRLEADFSNVGWWFGLPIAAGAVCYALLFYLLRYEKGENAEQASESWFGYKTLIPAYIALCLGTGAGEEIYGLAMLMVAGLVATIVYKRKFSLKLADWAPLAIGLVVGFILAAAR